MTQHVFDVNVLNEYERGTFDYLLFYCKSIWSTILYFSFVLWTWGCKEHGMMVCKKTLQN